MDTGAEGGKLLPLALFGLGTKALTGSGLNLWNFYDAWRRMDENKAYWSRYEKQTGFKVRYPFRTGSHNDYTKAALSFLAGQSQVFDSAYNSYGRFSGGSSYQASSDFDPYSNGYY